MTKEEIFAINLKKLRQSHNMTQKQLADMLCVSDKNLSKWECGRATPDVFYLQEICRIFDVEAEYFFREISEENIIKDIAAEKEKLNRLIWKWIAVILCLSSAILFITVVSRIFMPTIIPCHYNGKGEIDRWGSSREYVAVGITYCLIGYMVFFMKLFTSTQEANKKNINISGIVFLLMVLFFVGFEIGYAVKSNNYALDKGYLPQQGDTFASLFSAILCMIYSFCGSVCVGVKQNGIVGLRIPLTLNNSKAWYILNRGMGLSLIVSSQIMLVVVGLCNLLPIWTVIILPFLPMIISVLMLIVIFKINKNKFETQPE